LEKPIYYLLKTCKKFLKVSLIYFFLGWLLILVGFVKFVGAGHWNWIPFVSYTCAWTFNFLSVYIFSYKYAWLYTRL